MLLRRLARGRLRPLEQPRRGELTLLQQSMGALGASQRALGSSTAAVSSASDATYPASARGARRGRGGGAAAAGGGRGGGVGGRKRPLPGRGAASGRAPGSIVRAGWREPLAGGPSINGATAAAEGVAAASALPVCDRGVLPPDSPLRAAIVEPLERGDVAVAVQALQAAAAARQQVDLSLALRLLDATRGRWHLALDGLFNSPAFPVDERVVLHALRGCVAARRWRPAVAILEEALPKRGLAPPAAAYRQALLACGVCQETAQTLRLVEAMAARRLIPSSRDAAALATLVAEAAATPGAWDGALALCRHYFSALPYPNPDVIPASPTTLRRETDMVNSAIGACKRAVGEAYQRNERAVYGPMAQRLWEVVRLARQRRPEGQLALSREAWAALVKVASRAGRVGDVAQMVEAMADDGLSGAEGDKGPRVVVRGLHGSEGVEVPSERAPAPASYSGGGGLPEGEGRRIAELYGYMGRLDWDSARQMLGDMMKEAGSGAAKRGRARVSPPSENLVAAVLDCGLRGKLEAEALALFERWLERDPDFIATATARVKAVRACLRLLEEEREAQGWPAPTPATFGRRAGGGADTDTEGVAVDEGSAAEAEANSEAEAALRDSAAVRRLGSLLKLFEARTPGQRGVACGLAMEVLHQDGQVKDAFALLAALRALDVPRGPPVLLPLLRLCARAGRLKELVALVEGMEQGVDGMVPTPQAYIFAIEATGRAGMVEDSLRLHRAMRRRGYYPSDMLTSLVMSAIARSRDWETAVAFLEELKEAGGPMAPSVVLYTSAIDACGNGGAWETALALLAQMEAEGVAPNNFTFTAAIKGCGRAGQWEEAARLFAQMEARGLPINEITYTVLLDVHAKASRWEDAAATLRAMEQRGLTPSTPHYTAAIDACSRAGRYREALAWLEEMQDRHVPINRVAYTAAVVACGRGGAWDEALRLLLRMLPRAGERPSGISYMLAIDACGRAGQWPVAAYLWDLVGLVDPNELALPVLNSLICAMDDPALADQVDAYYARAYAQGQVNHWSVRWPGVMDLHHLSRPLAKAALRHVLAQMVAHYAAAEGVGAGAGAGREGYIQDPRTPLVVVTGHGQHRDSGRSVLRDELREFLATEFDPPLRARGVSSNRGRMQVPPADLLAYARAKLGLPPLEPPAPAQGEGDEWRRGQVNVNERRQQRQGDRRVREQFFREKRGRDQDRHRPVAPSRWRK